MKVFVIRDSDFTLANGQPASNLLHYSGYAKRYLQVFSSVTIVGRLFEVEDRTALPTVGDNVDFLALPPYRGPIEFSRCLWNILKLIWGSTRKDAAYILRVPATVPSLYAIILWLKRIPFAVEIAADPYDSYGPKVLSTSRFAWFYRSVFVALVKWQCKNASTTAYVTQYALQKRYPPGNAGASFSFTSIDLTDECYVKNTHVRTIGESDRPHLVLTGNMQKFLKGHDVFLGAIARLKREGIKTRATVIGFGENQKYFEEMAAALGLCGDVKFVGKLAAGKEIRDVLDSADLFVLPSRQEGLPRALLEAMARGLPAIATNVGGTSELLSKNALVEPADVIGLSKMISRFVSNENIRMAEARRNLEVARTYHVSHINSARLKFFNAVKRKV